jgi:hypothetical protein
MANIDESGLGGTYPASVVSLAATDAAEGAAEGYPNTGVMNGPIVALTGRSKYLKTLADSHTASLASLAGGLVTHTNQISVHTGQISSHANTLAEHADSIAALEAVDVTQNADIAELQETVLGLTAIPVYQSGNIIIDGSGNGEIAITDERVTGIDAIKGFQLLIKINSSFLMPPGVHADTVADNYMAGVYGTTSMVIQVAKAGANLQSTTKPYRLIIFV